MKQFKHWIILIGCCGLAASSMGIVVNTSGVFIAPVSTSLGVLRGTFSLVSTFTLVSTAIISLFTPQIINKLGIKKSLFAGSILVFGSTFLMGMAKSMIIFYLLGIIRGIGAGLNAILPITMIINKWFNKSNGLATSIVLSFSGVAGAFLSPVFSSLINSIGWQNTYYVAAIISLAVTLPIILYPFKLDPLEEGLEPYGGKFEVVNKTTTNTTFNPITLSFILFMTFAILTTGITGMPSHFPGFGESIGLSATTASLMLSASMIGNISSKLIIGILSDKLGAIKAVLVMMITNMIAAICMIILPKGIFVIIFAFMFGSIYSIGAVGIALLTRYFFGENNYAKAYSIVSFGTNLGGAFSMSLFGFIYDLFKSYTNAFILTVIFSLLNFGLLYILSQQKKQSI